MPSPSTSYFCHDQLVLKFTGGHGTFNGKKAAHSDRRPLHVSKYDPKKEDVPAIPIALLKARTPAYLHALCHQAHSTVPNALQWFAATVRISHQMLCQIALPARGYVANQTKAPIYFRMQLDVLRCTIVDRAELNRSTTCCLRWDSRSV